MRTETNDERTSILDVAALLVQLSADGLSTMQLHKLCYFAYGWSLILLDEPLFVDEFEAWKSGPVSRRLMDTHHGEVHIASAPAGGDARRVSAAGEALIRTMLKTYAGYSGMILAELSRRGAPWTNAFGDGPAGDVVDPVDVRLQFTELWTEREVRLPLPR